MKIIDTFSNKNGMLVIKVPRPFNKEIWYVIDDILVFLSDYGNYTLNEIGLAHKPNNSSYLNFFTNLPYSTYSNKK
jgi:hypothetical protein